MFETLLNPKKAERKPWELFFVGFFYAIVSTALVVWMFSRNSVFSQHLGILIVTFTVMLSIPFVYYTIKLEEEKEMIIKKRSFLIKEHGKAVLSLLYLFLGFLLAFSLVYIAFPESAPQIFSSQISQFCEINMPSSVEECVESCGITAGLTCNASSNIHNLGNIFINNIYVLVFCIIFSLVFGAGAIFILAWNATVIAAAIGIFAKSSLLNLPSALLRYMIHGLPEIVAYLTAALAGGIISVAVIRHNFKEDRFWKVIEDSVGLIILSIGILIVALFIEVFVTTLFF